AEGEVRTGMGEVQVGAPERLRVGDGWLELTRGSAGNPHAVVFVADVETADVHGLGALLQQHPTFTDGVNVEFVQVDGPDRLRQRTFERGSGETLACGTGATVAALAARAQRRIQAEVVHVALRGGALRVECGASTLALVGPTRTVFDGEVELPR
ncbi:MAG: diaminopimelate epimerase, partial [Planctomycetes bacterium]|nr:diaminopimelate epimerase [Planctomycetota bacterium]